jgi:hypothetical protein
MANLKAGDTVTYYRPLVLRTPGEIGIVIEVKDSEIYDHGMRVIVAWQDGDRSYEKEGSLKKLN